MIGREFSHPLLAAVAGKPELELQSALDRVIEAGMLFRQGAPPDATYLFKYALRMQLTARCCENGAERFMLGS